MKETINSFIKLGDKVIEQEEEIERLNNIIKEVREYIQDKYDYVLGDDTFLDHDDLVDRKRMQHILEILDKENKWNKKV